MTVVDLVLVFTITTLAYYNYVCVTTKKPIHSGEKAVAYNLINCPPK